MLEIREKTINGKSEKYKEHTMMQISIPVEVDAASGENYSQDNGFTLSPFKTIAKPTHMIFDVQTGTYETDSAYASAVRYFKGVQYVYTVASDYRNKNYGKVAVAINTDTDTTIQIESYSYHGYSSSGSVTTVLAYNDGIYLDKSNTTLTIRADIDNDLTDPVADFDTWGSEFSAGDYTTITTLNSTYVELQDILTSERVEMIGKFENIDVNCRAIMPVAEAKAYVNCNGHGTYSSTTSISVYNFTTTTWDSFGDIAYVYDSDDSYTTGNTTNVARGGNILTNTGEEDWADGKISDYLSSGAMYVKVSTSDTNDRRAYLYLNYLALLRLNGHIWA